MVFERPGDPVSLFREAVCREREVNITGGNRCANVQRATKAELLRAYSDKLVGVPRRNLDGVISRSRIDDHDLDWHRLCPETQ